MRLYLDDDLASPALARLLRNVGHEVQLPAEAGLAGRKDPIHLAHAIREDRVLLTRNYGDYEDLHNLIAGAHGHHSGIVVVRRDNDPRRNLTHHQIVCALGRLESSGIPIPDEYIILNHWR
jgi:predicted nuclease of predicted toxin-antitoxin system